MPILESFCRSAPEVLLGFLLRGALLLGPIWGILALSRAAAAAWRHRLTSLALAVLILLPALTAVLPAWELPLLPIGAAGWLGAAPATAGAGAAIGKAGDSRPELGARSPGEKARAKPAPPAGTGPGRAFSARLLALLLWGMVATLILLARLLEHLAAQRVAGRARTLRSGPWVVELARLRRAGRLQAIPSLALSDEVALPVLVGLRRPTVLVPTAAADWDPERVRPILLHETAHLERRDLPVRRLADLACALHWPNPLVWLLNRRLAREQELACDDRVLGSGVPACDYAHLLLELTRQLRNVRRAGPGPAAAMARGRDFRQRMAALLDPLARRGAPSAAANLAAALLVAMLALPLAGFRAASTTPAEDARPVVSPAAARGLPEPIALPDRTLSPSATASPGSRPGAGGRDPHQAGDLISWLSDLADDLDWILERRQAGLQNRLAAGAVARVHRPRERRLDRAMEELDREIRGRCDVAEVRRLAGGIAAEYLETGRQALALLGDSAAGRELRRTLLALFSDVERLADARLAGLPAGDSPQHRALRALGEELRDRAASAPDLYRESRAPAPTAGKGR